MSTTVEQVIYQDGAGIYYTDEIIFEAGTGTLTCEQIVYTTDPDLIDTLVPQVRSYKNPTTVLLKGAA